MCVKTEDKQGRGERFIQHKSKASTFSNTGGKRQANAKFKIRLTQHGQDDYK